MPDGSCVAVEAETPHRLRFRKTSSVAAERQRYAAPAYYHQPRGQRLFFLSLVTREGWGWVVGSGPPEGGAGVGMSGYPA